MTAVNLADFLLARIAEDEEAARGAIRTTPVVLEWRESKPVTGEDDGRWSVSHWSHESERVEGLGITIYDEGGHTVEQAAHIARNDPAHALAECEAKRRIIDLRRRLEHPRGGLFGPNKADAATAQTLADVFKLMAIPYADHPDFDPEWRA